MHKLWTEEPCLLNHDVFVHFTQSMFIECLVYTRLMPVTGEEPAWGHAFV